MVAPMGAGGAQPGDSIETLYVDIAARADQLVTDAEAAVRQVITRLDQLEDKNRELEKSYSRLGGFIRDALSVAAGMALARVGGNLTNAIMGFGRQLISTNAQMQTFEQSFKVLTGSAEEAGEIIEWVKEQAKATPFDIPGLINASQMLMTWGLDLKEWFTVVGDVAAGMNRPISQVVNAVGTLATGQTGEAVRRFRDLGINLREFTDVLQFDAQGSLITPLEEAIPIVRQIMIDRFGGMMEAQSKTWGGVMSNMMDTWQQFVQVVGEPIFETLNESLFNLYQWIEENQDQIEGFARTLGDALGTALDLMMSIVEEFGKFIGLVNQVASMLPGGGEEGGEGFLSRASRVLRESAGVAVGTGLGRTSEMQLLGETLFGRLFGISSQEAEENFRQRNQQIAELMNTIAGYENAVEDAGQATLEESEHMAAGLIAVRDAYEGVFGAADSITGVQDDVIKGMVAEGQEAQEFIDLMDQLGLGSWELVEAFEQETFAVRKMAEAYDEGVEQAERQAKAQQQVANALEEVNRQQAEALALAQEVALKMADEMEELQARYTEFVAEQQSELEEAIAELNAEAAEEEQAAVAQHQQAVAQLRENFLREQVRRRRQFNLEWARLIRDQNQEVLDAEWEYQYRKEQLLLEGDEIALAELEARYEHEKNVRDREQGDARSDLQSRFDEQMRQAEEQYQLQLKALQQQIQEELAAIKQRVKEETEAKLEAMEERIREEKERTDELYEELGRKLYEYTEGNDRAATLVAGYWASAYANIEVSAIMAGYTARQEMLSVIQLAVEAQQAIQTTPRGPIVTPGRGGKRHGGGYTPTMREATIQTLPNEFVLDQTTTRMLEKATGATLSQQSIKSFVESRRRVDFHLHGHNMPDPMIRALRNDMNALLDEMGREVE